MSTNNKIRNDTKAGKQKKKKPADFLSNGKNHYSVPADYSSFVDILKKIPNEKRKIYNIQNLSSDDVIWKGDIKLFFGQSSKTFTTSAKWRSAFINKEDIKNALKQFNKALKSCSPYDLQYRITNQSGSILHVIERGYFLPDSKGKAVYVIAILNDITEIKLKDDILRRNEKDFLSVLDKMPHYIYRIDLKGRITFANRAYCREFNISPSKIIGKTAYDLHPKELADKYTKDDNKVFRKNETFYAIEENAVKNSAKIEIVEVFKIPLHDSKGKVIGLQGVYWYITDRIAAQEKAKSAESNYNEIFNATGEAIFIHNSTSGRILDVNEMAAKVFGYSKKEMLSLGMNDISANDEFYNQSNAYKYIRKAAKGNIQNFEWKGKKKNGKLFWVEVTLRKTLIGGKGRVLAVVRDISERKKAEDKLKENEKKYHDTAELLPQGIIECDLTGKVTYVNKQIFELFKLTRKEYEEGIYLLEGIIEEEKEFARSNIEKILHNGKPVAYEYNMVKRDNTVFPAYVYSNVITNDGVPAGIRSVVFDLTEKRAQEKEKEERDVLFSLLFEKSGDANLLMRGETFFDCNNTTVKMLKANTKNDIIGKSPADFSPEYQSDGQLSSVKAKHHIELAYKEGNYRFEWLHKKLDGTLFDSEIVLTAIPLQGNWYLHVAWRDVTEMKNAERKQKLYYRRLEKLLEIEKRILSAGSTVEICKTALKHLRTILDCERATVVLLNREKNIFDVVAVDASLETRMIEGKSLNYKALAALREKEYLLTKDFTAEEELSEVEKGLLREGIRCRLSLPLMDGSEVVGGLNLGSVTPDSFNEEKILIAQEAALSLSLALQHANFLERINSQNAELEKRIEERTVELKQTINELESFSYSVSHDLRAPLSSIGGFSRAIVEDYKDVLDEEGKDNLNRIVSATQRMSDLIDALLLLARITRSEFKTEKCNISQIFESTKDDYVRLYKDRTNVKFVIQPDLYVTGDKRLLRILADNFIGNAWKFTQKKEMAIIEFGQAVIEGKETFFVKDNGVGFEMAYSHKLFIPFQRLHSRTEFEGTGIGLATIKRIVLRHRGIIWTESRENEGAAFYFTLGM